MPAERSSTYVGIGFTLSTAAAAGLGAPDVVWIAAGGLGALSFAAALLLHGQKSDGDGGSAEKAAAEQAAFDFVRSQSRDNGSAQQRQIAVMTAIGIAVVAGVVALAVTHLDLFQADSEAVIVCVDSSASTNHVRVSYLPDLFKVAHQAATQSEDFYADDCGVNATGRVDWAVRKKFGASRGGVQIPTPVLLEAEKILPPLEASQEPFEGPGDAAGGSTRGDGASM